MWISGQKVEVIALFDANVIDMLLIITYNKRLSKLFSIQNQGGA